MRKSLIAIATVEDQFKSFRKTAGKNSLIFKDLKPKKVVLTFAILTRVIKLVEDSLKWF